MLERSLASVVALKVELEFSPWLGTLDGVNEGLETTIGNG